jgi:uncharacterized protein
MKENIDRFMASSRFAIAGVSRSKNKFGNMVFREMKKKGYDVVPVNPCLGTFDGERCYGSVGELPPDVDALIVITKPEATAGILREAKDKGIRNIFLQQGSQSRAIIESETGSGEMNLISRHCILMFARPTGIHKFHGTILRLFGLYPKEDNAVNP